MLVDGRSGTGGQVTAAIRSASRTTGANFDYLLRTAIRESSLDPAAQAPTSSARGLYQFIESTWLTMVKEEGPKFGLGQFAGAIQRGADGQYRVNDPLARAQILKMRDDPEISSVMAGALARRNASELQSTLGRKPTQGELYVAHFLGVNGAKRLIQLQRSNPEASAAAAFPEAARANKAIFHAADGKARSAAEVFAALTGKHQSTPVRATAPTKLAAAQPIPIEQAPKFYPLRRSLPTESARSEVARAVERAEPAESAAKRTVNGPAPREAYAHPVLPRHTAFADEGPAFEALFRNGEQEGSPFSPAVRELWGSFDAGARGLREVAGVASAGKSQIGEPLNILAHLNRVPVRR